VIGFLAWLVRLEARSISNASEIRRLWVQRREDLDSARESRTATNTLLAELRTDIKTLLQRVAK
jgi:hypothetical protein